MRVLNLSRFLLPGDPISVLLGGTKVLSGCCGPSVGYLACKLGMFAHHAREIVKVWSRLFMNAHLATSLPTPV